MGCSQCFFSSSKGEEEEEETKKGFEDQGFLGHYFVERDGLTGKALCSPAIFKFYCGKPTN